MKNIIFHHVENARVAELVFNRLENRRDFTPAELLDAVNPEDTGKFARILNEECHCEDNNKAILDKIRRYRQFKLEKRQNEILEMLNEIGNLPEGDVEKLKLELKIMYH